jgi:mannose/fructose/N-acetylgalactosamine-specific phosphotransferase system component IID
MVVKQIKNQLIKEINNISSIMGLFIVFCLKDKEGNEF